MKKRILIVLAILVLFSLTVLAACDTHEHEYSWKSDESGHWQECACDDKTDKVAHADDNADEKCDVCGYNMHVHAYTWKSDAVNHWEECACGDKKTATPHVDVKNNATQAEGADGKCDVCALEIYVITFDMQGHGEAIDAVNIGKGGKVTAPATPADDDAWKFGGWYKDAECETAFDFATEIINEATTVYAKWTEDATEGASKAHAYALTLGEDSLQSIAKDQVVYFAYTAQANGRYTISLGNGLISQKCTFTTDKTEGTYNADNDKVNIDLAKDETVYVMLTCAEELSSDAMASVMIAECTGGDELPADLFLDGEYSNGEYYEFVLDRENMQIVYNDISYDAKYIGGEYNNKLVVTRDMSSLGMGVEVWTIAPNEDDTYTLKITGLTNETHKLTYVELPDPIPLSKFVGYYEPKNSTSNDDNTNPGIERDDDETPTAGSGITNGIIELYIYASESETGTYVRCKQIDSGNVWYTDLIPAAYDTAKNRLALQLNGIIITLNVAEDGSAESVNVDNNVYVRKGDVGAVPPASLPLEANAEYRGETHAIRTPNDSQLFGAEGNNGITVMGYDDEVYTIVVNNTTSFVTYKLTISEEDGIKLYAEDGTTLLDTLTKHEGQIQVKNLAVGETTTLTKEDFYQGLLHIKVTATGWYLFIDISDGLTMYANVSEYELEYYEFYGMIYDGVAVRLEQDAYIVVSVYDIGDGVSFIAQATEAPKGSSADDPYDYEEGLIVPSVNYTDEYFVKFTAPADGTYAISAFYLVFDDGAYKRIYTCYAIDGEHYGQCGYWWSGGTSEAEPYAVIQATEGQEIIVVITRPDEYGADPEDVTVEITEYVPREAIFTDEEAGTYFVENVEDPMFHDIITVTLTFDCYGKGTYFQGDYEYDVTMSKNDDGSYEFTYGNGDNATFSIVNGNLEITDSYLGELTLEKGESEEPVGPDIPEGIVYTGVLTSGNVVTLIISDDKVTYIVDSAIDSKNAQLQVNEGTYSFSNSFGDTHTFTISEDGNTIQIHDGWYDVDGTLTKEAE